MNKLMHLFNYFTGRTTFEMDHIKHLNQVMMFISDTPSIFYSELDRIIKLIKPIYIVHAGDLVDDIKLQLHPGAIRHYERQVLSLIKILENAHAEQVFLALGNHDSASYIHSKTERLTVIDEKSQFKINEIKVSVSHYAHQILEDASDLYLFGHDLKVKTRFGEDRVYLNGLTAIYLIDMERLEIISIDYPYGIDDARSKKTRIGF